MTDFSPSELTTIARLSLPLKKIICAFASYYNGKLYHFELTTQNNIVLKEFSSEQLNKKNNKCMLLIIAREFYIEKTGTYPIVDKRELNKLLKLETSLLSNNESQNTFHHCWQTNSDKNNNQSQVNIWQFKTSVPNAFLRLPETLLFALTLSEQQIMHKTVNNKGVYITHINGLIHSLPQSSVVNSPDNFAMSVGVAQSQKVQVIKAEQLAEKMIIGLKKLTLPILSSFIKAPQVANRLQLVKNIALPFLLVFSCYLALSSAYLIYEQHNLQQQFTNQSSEVSSALQQQVIFDKKLARYNAFKKFLSQQTSHSSFWLIMADIFPAAKFTNVRVNNNRYVLRGTAIKATKVLELLSRNKQVIGAKFDFPTQKNRGRENFVISFKLSTATRVNANG
ncbi:MAG: hypothetical protein COA85_13385 [Robiginitomaculum sp.]|nr:MAG: hypothetical protein COA85_13385 [Robiginitomaculum sp.]